MKNTTRQGQGEKAEFQEVRIWVSGWERKRTETRENKAWGKESGLLCFPMKERWKLI